MVCSTFPVAPPLPLHPSQPNFPPEPCAPYGTAGNGTRYRVLLGANDTGGEYFSVEVLMRKEAYGAVRGTQGRGPSRGRN